MATTWRNWAGNQRALTAAVARPCSVQEVQELVRRATAAGTRVKAVGSGHSFSDVAVTDGVLVDLARLSGLETADPTTGRVRVRAGTPLHVLNRGLAARKLAMSNLGDIDRQTVAGAISTGTHGTGARLGGLATQVRALELVLADGSLVRCDEATDADLFEVARLSLGALGIITSVELQCEPAFALHAREVPMPLDDVLARIDELADGSDHFEFFWFPGTSVALTKTNNRLAPGEQARPLPALKRWLDDELFANTAFGLTARLARRWPHLTPRVNRFAGRLLSARDYSDASHRVFCSSRRVRFLEMEYAVPREHVVPALEAIRRVLEVEGHVVSFPVEVRFAAADDIPLSTAYGRDSAYLAVHVFEGQDHVPYFASVERELRALGGRPHWGKLHTRTADDLRPDYPRFEAFLAARDRVDPNRVFGNAYLDRVLGATAGART